MPRVKTKTKNRGGKALEYRCARCSDPIVPGDKYHEWSFRYGGTFRQHVKHGHPRQSQLTQSIMGEVYASVENVEDILGGDGWDVDDVKSAVEELREVVEQTKSQYEEAAEPFGGQGPNQERADELDTFLSTLDNIDIDDKPETAAERAARERHERDVADWQRRRDAAEADWREGAQTKKATDIRIGDRLIAAGDEPLRGAGSFRGDEPFVVAEIDVEDVVRLRQARSGLGYRLDINERVTLAPDEPFEFEPRPVPPVVDDDSEPDPEQIQEWRDNVKSTVEDALAEAP